MNDKSKKLKNDIELLKYSKYQDRVREMISFLGADPDTVMKEDTDENISIVMKAKSLVDVAFNSEMFNKDEATNKYSVLAKISAIAVLTGSLAIKSDLGIKGDPIPYYSAVEKWIDIPEETLRRWWRGKEAIQSEFVTLSYASVMKSSFEQATLIEDMTSAIKKHTKFEDMVNTPAGLNAVTNAMGKIYFLMLGMNEVGDNLKRLTKNKVDETKQIEREVDLVTPVPISTTKGNKKVGSITDKE